MRQPLAVLTSWLNSIGLPSRPGCTQFPIDEIELHAAFQDGQTLIELLKLVAPDSEAELMAGIHKRCLTSATAIANIEHGLRFVWRANPSARNMPTALELYAASAREAILRFVDELFAIFAERPARRQYARVLAWSDAVLRCYGRGISTPSLAPPFRTLGEDFRSGTSMACLLHHAAQLAASAEPRGGDAGSSGQPPGEPPSLPDLGRVYWEPEDAAELESNLAVVLPALSRLAPARSRAAYLAAGDGAPLLLVQLCALWRACKGALPVARWAALVRYRDHQRQLEWRSRGISPRARAQARAALQQETQADGGENAGVHGVSARPIAWDTPPLACTVGKDGGFVSPSRHSPRNGGARGQGGCNEQALAMGAWAAAAEAGSGGEEDDEMHDGRAKEEQAGAVGAVRGTRRRTTHEAPVAQRGDNGKAQPSYPTVMAPVAWANSLREEGSRRSASLSHGAEKLSSSASAAAAASAAAKQRALARHTASAPTSPQQHSTAHALSRAWSSPPTPTRPSTKNGAAASSGSGGNGSVSGRQRCAHSSVHLPTRCEPGSAATASSPPRTAAAHARARTPPNARVGGLRAVRGGPEVWLLEAVKVLVAEREVRVRSRGQSSIATFSLGNEWAASSGASLGRAQPVRLSSAPTALPRSHHWGL